MVPPLRGPLGRTAGAGSRVILYRRDCVAAIVGPYTGGKTSLFESLLFVSGGITRKGAAADRSRLGDAQPEAKSREMSVEAVAAMTTFLDETWTLLDCPGSVEFLQDTRHALMVADIAVVVCDPDPARAVMVAPFLKFLDDHDIPHLVFVNRMEHAKANLGEILESLQAVSERTLVMRQLPIVEGEAERDHGVNRLWKALRHDAPTPQVTWDRRKAVTPEGLAQVFKTQHAAHTGRLSWVRVWQGQLTDGMTLGGQKVGGLYALQSAKVARAATGATGAVVAVARLEDTHPGDVLSEAGISPAEIWPQPPQALFALKLATVKVGDDVKLSTALAKLTADDVSLSFGHDPDTGELLLWGMGEVHLMVAVESGVRESLAKGPLGFPVVDVGVTLTDGSYHTVDSSEQAFKTAAGIGMRAALPKCDPILLEPIWSVSVAVPSEWTSKAQRALSQRRAQILGYDKRPG